MSSAFVAVNILGNTLATIVIAKWEGAVDVAALQEGLRAGPGTSAIPISSTREA
jgi:aerobic C4-dicarboxylate transport protein